MRNFLKKYTSLINVFLLSVVSLCIFFISEYIYTDEQFGVPLDDAYIHFQFSKNIAEGKGFSFNPNNPTPGSTSPAWTLLLTLFYILYSNHLIIAKFLSALFYILAGISTYFLSKEILKNKKLALCASIFTLLSGRLAWSALSGMEVTLFTFLLILFLYFNLKKKSPIIQSTTLGIASAVRPEGYIIFAFFMLSEIYKAIKLRKISKSFIIDIFIAGLTYLSLIAPYFIFSYIHTGSLLPNTFRAQSTSSYDILFRLKLAGLYLLRYAYLVFIDNPVLALGIPFGLYFIFKTIKEKNYKYLMILSISIGFPLVASFSAPNLRHHGRYTMPFIPMYIIIGFMGLCNYLRDKIENKIKHPAINLVFILLLVYIYQMLDITLPGGYLFIGVIVIFLLYTAYKLFRDKLGSSINISFVKTSLDLYIFLSLIFTFLLYSSWVKTYCRNVKNINDMHAHLGNWVSENSQKDDLIALNDIGAITYISQRETIDLVGLTSPEVLERINGLTKDEREEPLWDLILEKQPDYIIIFPSWYPEISSKDELEEVYRVKLVDYSIVDGEMEVYKLRK